MRLEFVLWEYRSTDPLSSGARIRSMLAMMFVVVVLDPKHSLRSVHITRYDIHV